MAEAALISQADDQATALRRLLLQQRTAFSAQPYLNYQQRLANIRRLDELIAGNQSRLLRAMSRDFGHRSEHEAALSDIITVRAEISHIKRYLRSWMRRRPVAVDWKMWPGRAWIDYQPLGVVGVLAPWNYPANLVLSPMVTAMAAGNTVMAKPSEHTPETGHLLQTLIADAFSPDYVSIVTGGVEVSKQFAALPFDHLFFTGSTAVGKQVMRAAAANLTPVTLELGGKTPVVISASADLQRTASRVGWGKWYNAGQTCIAPDYVLINQQRRPQFVAELEQYIIDAYGSGNLQQDLTRIINQQQFQRLQQALDEAVADGAEILQPLGPADQQQRRFPPTLVINPAADSSLMQEEIFGPILPIVDVGDPVEARVRINAGPRPLALYYFGRRRDELESLLQGTHAGSVCINDCLLQFAEPNLPFGGIGDSGMGESHGHQGFLTFTKAKPVLQQARWSGMHILKPPYGKLAGLMLRWLSR